MEGLFLAESVADCVSRGGEIPENILDSGGNFLINDENFLGLCNLNFKVEEYMGWDNDQFFVSIEFSAPGEKTPYSISSGNKKLQTNCNVNMIDTSNKNHFPFCVERNLYSNGKDGKYYLVKIFAGVRKTEKNA
jgi:hypothetical protein